VLLFGGGFAVPGNLEPCTARRYFSQVHYLALVSDEASLRRRLLERPAWRGTRDEKFIAAQMGFNRWLIEEGPRQQPPVALLDTTAATVEAAADAVLAWSMEAAL
jgi:hypothetical protein